jgi:hypothetical protein
MEFFAPFAAMFDIHRENFLLENMSFLATLVGLPVLLISYWTNQHNENRRREFGTYDALESGYIEFQRLTLLYPRLDIAETPLSNPPADLSDAEMVQRRTLYMVLFSLFERAFLMYHRQSFWRLFQSREQRAQWKGWSSFMERYAGRSNCAQAWFNGEPPRPDVRQDFDDNFEKHMFELFKKAGQIPGA